jgi:hypothetical protein
MKFQKELDSFAEKAKAYCEWAKSDFTECLEELSKAEKFLAELHLAILNLPDANEVWNEVDDLEDVSEDKKIVVERWKQACKRFENLPVNGYWEIFDASNIDDENPVFSLVSDDLADIYSDLKRGLLLYEKGKFAEAFWEWKFNFKIHWGNHLVGAMKTIRNYFSYKTEI